MCEPAKLNRIIEVMHDLSEDSAREVLDFAEFLKTRRGEDETAYLLREPANARRLLKAAEDIRRGVNIEARELLPDDRQAGTLAS